MNDRERLLTDTLDDGEGAAFARAAAAHARRRALRPAGLAGFAIALATAFFCLRPSQHMPPAAAPAPSPTPAYEVISDDELLSQLKDRPVLILKSRTGISGVVFLPDKPPGPTM